MADAAWKAFERRAARFFGAERRVLSGNRSGRDDVEPGDSVHPRLHIEAKLRDKHSVFRLWDAARAAERKARGRKLPVICLQEGGRPGFMVCIHSDDMAEVCAEYLAARCDEELLEFEAMVRSKRLGIEED
jgi:hypothetical protein